MCGSSKAGERHVASDFVNFCGPNRPGAIEQDKRRAGPQRAPLETRTRRAA